MIWQYCKTHNKNLTGSGKKDKLARKWRRSTLRSSTEQKELRVRGQGSTVGCGALIRMRSASRGRRGRGRRRGTHANPHTSKMPGLRSQRREKEENKQTTSTLLYPKDLTALQWHRHQPNLHLWFRFWVFFLSSAQVSILSQLQVQRPTKGSTGRSL